jgi:hypothetical protein
MKMNFDEMQSLWNSPGNRPPTTVQQQLADKFTRQMIRRRRFEAAWLINTFIWLTVITVLAVWNVIEKKVALGQEWALIPLLLVPWAFAIHFLRGYLKPAGPIARGEVTVAESFRTALSSNRTEQSHLKLVGVLFTIMIPVLALSMWQLRATHKVLAHELNPMATFFGGVLLVSGTGVAVRYFRRVLPQQRQLNSLLAELNEQ